MANTCRKVVHLIVDSGPLIKNAPLHEISECIYTLEDVVAEIKDKATKQRLQFLPFELKFREPPSELIKLVTEFSKKTGDYPSLSATDIRLLALTLFLEKENVGINHINTEKPINQVVVYPYTPSNGILPAGFYFPHEKLLEESLSSDAACVKKMNCFENALENNTCIQSSSIQPFVQNEMDNSAKLNADDPVSKNFSGNVKESIKDNCIEDDDDDDDEGWITPQNIDAVNKKIEALTLNDGPIPVACITTDFAMQNVLLQMGLKLVSIEGKQISQTKTFILRCHACFKTTSIMTKTFCPYCGNKTLKRVSVYVNEDGTKSIQINFKKPINIRGTRYSLPMPRGGKHANNPILCEDQPLPQNKSSQLALKKIDVFDPNYIANQSPFAINDVYSRAAHRGIKEKFHHNCHKNPNENKRHCRKKH